MVEALIAAGSAGTYSSPNGSTWTSRGGYFADTNGKGRAAWSPTLGLYIMVGQYGRFWTSPDGITWTYRAAHPDGPMLNGVAWSEALGRFVLVGDSGKIATSDNGTTLTARTSGTTDNLSDVAWSEDLGIFVATRSSGGLGYLTSPDGITWTARALGPGSQDPQHAVCWAPTLGKFISVGGIYARSSSDGITWTQAGRIDNSGGLATFKAVGWIAGLGILVAADMAGLIYTSPDAATWTQRVDTGSGDAYSVVWSQALELAAVGSTDGVWISNDGITWARGLSSSAHAVAAAVLNSPPFAPTWVTPQNTVIPTDADFDLDWDFHDPDPGDSQSEYVLDRWTLDGPGGARIAGSNVRVTAATPNTYRRITAGTLAVGAYEYKVATRDSQGAPTDPAQLVFSESLFVTAAESPDPPTFVAPGPIAGETISTSSREYVISAPDVDASEWTLYADNNGTIDTTTVLAGPVTKTTGDLRRHTFTGLANNTAVWAQVEIKDGGLWSQPTQQRNPVAYSPPPAPTYTLIEDPAEGEIVIQINNPAPGTGEVATSYNDVFITDPGKPEQRHATEIPANGAWTYQLPPSGFDGITTGVVRVEAVADNGTRTSSA